MKIIFLLGFFILTACQTSDFGLVTEDKTKKDQTVVDQPAKDDSLDQKKVNKNKLFNTSEDKGAVRPKIGLILGPGLSYSLAHLGALKAINDQKIPIHVVAGMDWSSLIAANFALNGAVNDMRWKAFQGHFGNAVSTGFLRGTIKETSNDVYDTLINQYTRGRNIAHSKISFICPAIQISKGKELYYKNGSFAQALMSCMKVPPLAQSESASWAFVTEAKGLVQQMRTMGAEKIVYIGAIPSAGMNWGKESGSLEGRDKYFWAQVINAMDPKAMGADHSLNLATDGHLALDFKNVKRMIEDSEQKAQDYFARFARTYSF